MYQAGRPARDEWLSVRGLQYHINRWGPENGPVVLLLHGWMDCGATFQFLVDHLPQSWRIIAPDWRGFGESQWADDGYYFPEYLADLDTLIDHLSPESPVALVGHSMGGNIASLYAGIKPARVSHLVSLEGFGLAPTDPGQAPARYRTWLAQERQPWPIRRYPGFGELTDKLNRNNPRLGSGRAAFVARCWAREDPPDGIVLCADPRHKKLNPVLYRLEESRACWRETNADTLWIVGAASPFGRVDNDVMAENRRCYATLQEVIVPEAGHMLHHDQPAAVAALLVRFLATFGNPD